MKVTNAQRRAELAVRHRLVESEWVNNIPTITNDLVALHSSDPATVFLTVGARMHHPSIESVEQALYQDRSVVRQHAMRRTLWVMTHGVADQAFAAVGAKVASSERKRLLGWLSEVPTINSPEQWLAKAGSNIEKTLGSRRASTREIGLLLPHLGVRLIMGSNTKSPASVKAHGRVMFDAAFNRQIIRGAPTGSWISSEYQWENPSTWLDTPQAVLDERESMAALTANWLDRFGPGTTADIQWWFGTTKTAVKVALETCRARSVTLEDGSVAWVGEDFEPQTPVEPWVALLPGLDPTPMGWKQRDWYLPEPLQNTAFDRNGNVGPTVWINGQIAGGWAQREDGEIVTQMMAGSATGHTRRLNKAVERVQGLLGSTVVRPRFPSPHYKQLVAQTSGT